MKVNMKDIGSKLVLAFNKTKMQAIKHSPEMLVAVGIVGVIGGAVLACKATLKAEDILAETNEQLDKIHKVSSDPKKKDIYSEEDRKKDLTIVYAKTVLKFAKLYGPAIVLEALSVTSILSGHNILHKRHTALAAAYATVDKGFKEYRARVKEQFGDDVERRIKNNLKVMEIEDKVKDADTGEEYVQKKPVEVAETHSEYARFFDECCPDWEKDSEYNLMFLRNKEEYANILLRSRGHLFLNEVYDMLGIPRTKLGQTVGWVYDPKDSTLSNYVDFGIYNVHRSNCRDFVNGYERSILLDFNVDGPILDLLA